MIVILSSPETPLSRNSAIFLLQVRRAFQEKGIAFRTFTIGPSKFTNDATFSEKELELLKGIKKGPSLLVKPGSNPIFGSLAAVSSIMEEPIDYDLQIETYLSNPHSFEMAPPQTESKNYTSLLKGLQDFHSLSCLSSDSDAILDYVKVTFEGDCDDSTKKTTQQNILPLKDKRNILITAALPYVNNYPHLGNIIGALLSADVYARYCRLRSYQTLFIGGTDEYGTATETKALEMGLGCKELCDHFYLLHSEIYDWFQISCDHFGRTSTDKQTEITHEIYGDLCKGGYFFEDEVEQCFCEHCSRFLADRYVEGRCPHCSYDDARGDQCDQCSKLLAPTDLLDARCKVCSKEPIRKKSKHLFLDLSKLQPMLQGFVEEQGKKGDWSSNSLSISNAWLKEGLRPRCMTRDLKWGTPVPGMSDKVFYVWFDACIGYISITANLLKDGDLWRQWWQAPKNDKGGRPTVELCQFMGKDNVPFHTVIFPSTLLGTSKTKEECKWTLLHHINTTEYLNYEGGKFSKSRNVGVFGNDAKNSGLPVSVFRYYLLAIRPDSGTDSNFSWDELALRTNNELLSNLGNFLSRIVKYCATKFSSIVPPIRKEDWEGLRLLELKEKIALEHSQYLSFMERGVHLKMALKQVMKISSIGNTFLTESNLDNKSFLADPSRCGSVIGVALNISYLLSSIIDPFVPELAKDIRRNLKLDVLKIHQEPDVFSLIPCNHRITKTPILLVDRITKEHVEELKAKFGGGSSGAADDPRKKPSRKK